MTHFLLHQLDHIKWAKCLVFQYKAELLNHEKRQYKKIATYSLETRVNS